MNAATEPPRLCDKCSAPIEGNRPTAKLCVGCRSAARRPDPARMAASPIGQTWPAEIVHLERKLAAVETALPLATGPDHERLAGERRRLLERIETAKRTELAGAAA